MEGIRDDGAGRGGAPVRQRPGGHAAAPLPQPAPGWAWFLDVDGTLVGIEESPDRVRIEPTLARLLADVFHASGGALALVSGRSIESLDRLFAPVRFPVAGQHGAERRDASGRMHVPAAPDPAFPDMAARARRWADSRPGILVEDKGLTLAIHYRAAPSLGPAAGRFVRSLLRERPGGFEVQRGKKVFEVKPAGRDKGAAVLDFLGEPPFRGRPPAFIGDDTNDEHAFAVVNALGGVSIKVGRGRSCARWRLDGVEGVRAYLARLVRQPPSGAPDHEYP